MPLTHTYLSTKPIPPRERLIFAMDVASTEQAKQLVDELGDSVQFYKLGLEIFMAGRYFELLAWLRAQGKKAFVDLKFFDVPQTVESAVKQLHGRGASFVTVHGNDEILAAAVAAKNGGPGTPESLKILAVTVLTSLDQRDIEALGFQTDVAALVLSRAKRAIAIGCDGVISSGLEARPLREQHGAGFLIVVPGIRPVVNVDDQKRTVDVEDAFLNGADYIVVGRPIKNADDKKRAAEDIQTRISHLFASR
ncbi:MAG: orotidine-5'-phosphate decarboxylase [Blastocatellia bacterium]|nr:MAG: orotidine-5'-phosphate decarboxylase [Blastocatellia bacterium]